MTAFSITEQPNVFDDHLLDIIGNEFKFDHAKGLAEWIKNSVDAYNREANVDGSLKYSDDEQFVYLRLRPKTIVSPVAFECVDFVGMTHDDIENAFKRWGDPHAASRGKGKRFLGGHGNGGKFYMRQMFKESRFITYRDGRLNVFGFNENKRYGFDKTYEDKPITLKRALQIADLETLLPHLALPVRRRLDAGQCGFTVVVGEAPHKIKRRNAPRSILQRLVVHPQARRLVARKQIFATIGDSSPFRLLTETISPRPGFEGPFEYDVPRIIQHGGTEVELANAQFPSGKLVLKTSAEPFNRYGDRVNLNCIDIIGEIGVIGSYRMNELGPIHNFTETEFIYGDCSSPILEDPADDCVRNDREKLIENEKTAALLSWICEKVNDLADKMASKSSEEQHVEELKQSSLFNDFLNQWIRKSRFWEKLRGEIFGGPGVGAGFGGTGGGGSPSGKRDGADGGDGSTGPDDKTGGGEGDKKKQGPKFPDVRLSNCDPDPLCITTTVNCEAGHPPVYQRDVDVPEGIFWINTQSPFAKKIRDSENYGPNSTRWREYMFQRHMDIIVKQAIYETEKQEAVLSAARIDGLLDKITKQVYEAAANDPSLESFLFHERLDTDGENESQVTP
jgi:hypothetical protein